MKERSDKKAGEFNLAKIFILLLFVALSCKKAEETRFFVLPEKKDAELHFRGFVTDESEELVSQIHYFSRKVTNIDSSNGIASFVFTSNEQETRFYTDENGTVWQKNREDIGVRIPAYGYFYKQSLVIDYWQILLKTDKGKGTEWTVNIDTTFGAVDSEGKTHRIRFIKRGKARYEGWTTAFIPEPKIYNYMKVADAHWYQLDSFILNETTGDTLFASVGSAHQYFEPKLGSIKYISDFTKYEIGKEKAALRGTWELVRNDFVE